MLDQMLSEQERTLGFQEKQNRLFALITLRLSESQMAFISKAEPFLRVIRQQLVDIEDREKEIIHWVTKTELVKFTMNALQVCLQGVPCEQSERLLVQSCELIWVLVSTTTSVVVKVANQAPDLIETMVSIFSLESNPVRAREVACFVLASLC